MATKQSSPSGGASAATTRIVVPGAHNMVALLGSSDQLLRLVEHAFTSDIHVRGNEITITGEQAEVDLAARLFEELITLLDRGDVLTADAVQRSLAMLRQQTEERPADVLSLNVLSTRGRTIRPKTLNQKRYVDAIDSHTIVFGIGPAGTGKTYLAMAKAVQALQAKQVNRIILTRPAVEAGERLGFLPGTLNEKIDPYLRPLYDALHDMVDPDSIPRLMANGTIEVAPLAYMRGRAQPVDTPVLTPRGFQPIGELRVGDLVVGSDGTPTVVLGVYPQGNKAVYRVTARDGASTLACAEHLWAVKTRHDTQAGRPWRVVQTQDMVGKLGPTHSRNFQLPVAGPVEFEGQPTPIDPYAVGLLLGDGRNTAATTPASALEDGRRGGVIVAPPVTTSSTRFIPEQYLLNTPDVRQAVLQGLLDADRGSVRQAGRSCRIRYTTRSSRLRDDVVFLVRSLGGVADCPVDVRSDAYVIDIRLPDGGRPTRMIESIEPAGEAECVCIAVSAEDSLYVTEDFLVTHNSLNDAFVVLDEAQNTSAEQMKMFLTRLGFGSQMVVTGDVTQIDLPAGTRSGLKIVQDILDGIEDVHFCRLTSQDVVRHRLVSEIVDAYAKWDAENNAAVTQQPASPRRRTGR